MTEKQAPHVLAARPKVVELLRRLHRVSLEQEATTRGQTFPQGVTRQAGNLDGFEDKLVALDEDKASAMYQILRAARATRVIEAGTSYGVSLMWLLSAVLDNTANTANSGWHPPPLVVGTELESSKAAKAQSHIQEAFGKKPGCLRLLVGDLLTTLPELLKSEPKSSIDCLLLDIWAPLALPTLEAVVPYLRPGAVVFIDNTVSSAKRYEDVLTYLRVTNCDRWQCITLPYSHGFEMCVYRG